MKSTMRPCLFVVAIALAVAGIRHFDTGTATLRANSVPFLADSDGDLLPDNLEWVLMMDPTSTDSDGDGLSDFLEATEHEPIISTRPVAGRPQDHEMRVSVSLEPWGSERVFVVHALIRQFNPSDPVRTFKPFINVQGVHVPLDTIAGASLSKVRRKILLNGTVHYAASFTIGFEHQIRPIMPCTVGAVTTIGTKTLQSGVLVDWVDGASVAYARFRDTTYALQPLDAGLGQSPAQGASQEPGNFWNEGEQVCEIDLQQLGAGGGNVICQVVAAGCTGYPTLKCAPSCQSQLGATRIVPNGLALLNGY